MADKKLGGHLVETATGKGNGYALLGFHDLGHSVLSLRHLEKTMTVSFVRDRI